MSNKVSFIGYRFILIVLVLSLTTASCYRQGYGPGGRNHNITRVKG